MKKIGFVDYYLSEWHANNYPAWMKAINPEWELAYAWAEQSVSPVDGVSTDEWCEKNGAEKCETLAQLCEQSDVIVVLAPTNPEKHLGYAEEVLKYGKRTYIDKTFAPDLATAKQIFALAEQYGTPFFSTSALRYATELDGYENCRQMFVTAGGSNIAEYLIHPIEMVVKKLGTGAVKVMTEQFGAQTHLHIAYADDRSASIVFARSMPYTVYLSDGTAQGARPVYAQVQSKFFDGLIADMLRFFETGTVSFDGSETLEVMRVREGLLRATESMGTWLEI